MEGKTVTWLQLASHSQKNDVWVLIEGKVYDVTTYLAEHPGGDDILIQYGGKDATQRFKKVNHTEYAISIRDQRLVGKIQSQTAPPQYHEIIKKLDIEKQEYTWQEVAQHNKPEDCWIVYNNDVLNVTGFLNEHPGGSSVLTSNAGKDASKSLEHQPHSDKAKALMADQQIGKIKPGSLPVQVDSYSSSSNTKIILVLIGILIGFFYSKYFKPTAK